MSWIWQILSIRVMCLGFWFWPFYFQIFSEFDIFVILILTLSLVWRPGKIISCMNTICPVDTKITFIIRCGCEFIYQHLQCYFFTAKWTDAIISRNTLLGGIFFPARTFTQFKKMAIFTTDKLNINRLIFHLFKLMLPLECGLCILK